MHCDKDNNIKLQIIPLRTRMEICSYIFYYNAQFMRCKDRIMNWKLHKFSIPAIFINYFTPLKGSWTHLRLKCSCQRIMVKYSGSCQQAEVPSPHFHQPFSALFSVLLLLLHGAFCHCGDFLLFVVLRCPFSCNGWMDCKTICSCY